MSRLWLIHHGGISHETTEVAPQTKATIILEGLKGKPVATICQDYQISQTQYYQWRDQFFANAPKTFEVAQQTEREARLQRENARLKNLVGELTLELKKSDAVRWP